MQIMEKPHNACGLFGWFTYERRNWIGAVLIAAAGGFGVGNGHTTQGAITHISQQLGDAKKKATCEHHVAEKAKAVALQGIAAANIAEVPAPDPKSLPVDNCPK